MRLLESSAKALFAKRSCQMVDPSTMRSMREAGRYIDIGYAESVLGLLTRYSVTEEGLFYFELLGQVLNDNKITQWYNDTMTW